MFFRRYQRERPEPVTILSGATPEGAAFLAHAHERLLECHVYMEDPPYTAYEASTVIGGADPPTFGVLATWNAATLGAGGGWHGWTDLGLSDAMPAALAAYGAFVVNEAYSLVQGWAEGSLQAADAILADHFGLARPWDFAASEYPVHVAQTAKAACEAATATVPNGTSGGDSGAYDDDALCFLGNASLLLADGRRVPLSAARVGDRVATGFGGGAGRIVTRVLKHAVDASVALVAVANGLVGTATHPIYLGGAWVPLDRVGARAAVAASALARTSKTATGPARRTTPTSSAGSSPRASATASSSTRASLARRAGRRRPPRRCRPEHSVSLSLRAGIFGRFGASGL